LRRLDVYETNTIVLGMIFGLIGYFVLSSHFVLRLFYPDVDTTNSEPTFVGMAICGIGFGYFAKEFAGVSKKAVEDQVKKILARDSEAGSANGK
ncbi:MAG: hypothetical protein AAFR27_04440, partial [Pseudomonadota bacterium]